MVKLRARLYQVALVRWADVPKAAVAPLDLPDDAVAAVAFEQVGVAAEEHGVAAAAQDEIVGVGQLIEAGHRAFEMLVVRVAKEAHAQEGANDFLDIADLTSSKKASGPLEPVSLNSEKASTGLSFLSL